MARARNIKPGFFANDTLAELEPFARLLFIGLWTAADRAGRLEDRVKKIKATVLPYDDCDVDGLLSALAKAGFLIRYSVGENKYIQIVNFDRHQNPHKNEAPSEIPAPEHSGLNRNEHQCTPADSLLLIPDSLTGTDVPVVSQDPAETIWKTGAELISASGVSTSTARSFLGGLVKHYGETQVAEKIAALALNPKAEPRSWLKAALNGTAINSGNENLNERIKRKNPTTPNPAVDRYI